MNLYKKSKNYIGSDESVEEVGGTYGLTPAGKFVLDIHLFDVGT
jgi:hypothetical protein